MKLEQRSEDKTGRWTSREHMMFLEGLKLYGRNWTKVAQLVKTRNSTQVRSHAQKHDLRERAAAYNQASENPREIKPRPTMVDKEIQYGEGVVFGSQDKPSFNETLDFKFDFSFKNESPVN